MEKISRMERKSIISSREGNFNKGRGPSHPHLHNELFQAFCGVI